MFSLDFAAPKSQKNKQTNKKTIRCRIWETLVSAWKHFIIQNLFEMTTKCFNKYCQSINMLNAQGLSSETVPSDEPSVLP